MLYKEKWYDLSMVVSGLNFAVSRELSLSQNGFAFTAIKHWNSLPSDLKSINNIRVFKQRLKQFLFTRYD